MISITLSVIFVFLFIFLLRLKLHSINRLYLEDIKDIPEEFSWPSLAIIVAGRNEGAKIEPALRSLAAIDYLNLEIIAINDRSDDASPQILDRLAAELPKIKALHISDLPPGWLGKNHALNHGLKKTNSDWVLFTDADIIFAEDTLKKAIFYAETNRIDHMTAYPEMIYDSILEKSFISAFGIMFAIDRPSWRVENLKSNNHLGIGAFNLIRSTCLKSIDGFEAIKLSVDDDIRLSELLKASGYQPKVAFAVNQIAVKWQDDIFSYIKGFEKNAFGNLNYSLLRVFFTVIGVALLTLLPWLSLALGSGLQKISAAAIIFVQAMILHDGKRHNKIGAGYVFLFPLSGLLLIAAIVLSAYATLKNNGIRWRGTLYPLAELKAHTKARTALVKDLRLRNRSRSIS